MYDRLAEAGYGYGPAFQGLRRAWKTGEEIFCEVALEETQAAGTGFLMHPALLDASFHGALAQAFETDTENREREGEEGRGRGAGWATAAVLVCGCALVR